MCLCPISQDTACLLGFRSQRACIRASSYPGFFVPPRLVDFRVINSGLSKQRFIRWLSKWLHLLVVPLVSSVIGSCGKRRLVLLVNQVSSRVLVRSNQVNSGIHWFYSTKRLFKHHWHSLSEALTIQDDHNHPKVSSMQRSNQPFAFLSAVPFGMGSIHPNSINVNSELPHLASGLACP